MPTDHESEDRARLRELSDRLVKIQTKRQDLERLEYMTTGEIAELKRVVQRYEADTSDGEG